jgi:hypothetical protein
VLPANEELAKTLIEVEATTLVDNSPSSLNAGGMLEQLFTGPSGLPGSGIISDIYESRELGSLDYNTGLTLLQRFLEERAAFDPYRRVMEQLGSNMVPTNLDEVLEKIRTDRERISNLNSSGVEEVVPDNWDTNAIEQVPTNISFLDVAMDGGPAKGEVAVLLGPTGGGKDQPLDAQIQTPYGPIRMGDVKIGQLISSTDGTTSIVTGIFPQGRKHIYEIKFNDGSTVKTGQDHLWVVNLATKSTHLPDYRTMTTSSIGEAIKKVKIYVDTTDPIFMPAQTVELDPYFLGHLLDRGFFEKTEVVLPKCTAEFLDELLPRLDAKTFIMQNYPDRLGDLVSLIFKATLEDGTPNPIVEAVSRLGLTCVKHSDRFIPQQYLYNDVENRRLLLQGLMDSNTSHPIGTQAAGVCTYGKSFFVMFNHESNKLGEQLKWLAESIGGVVIDSTRHMLDTRIGKIAHSDETKEERKVFAEEEKNRTYRMVSTPLVSDMFRLVTTHNKVLSVVRRTATSEIAKQFGANRRMIVSVTKLKDKEPTQCISVSHPNRLYLTDNCIPTHNTLMGIMIAVNGARYQVQQANEGKESGYWYYFSYESPITPDIRCRLLSYAAEIHFGVTMKKFKGVSDLSTSEQLKEYEKKRWDKQIKAGLPVPGELERYNAALAALGDKLKLSDMSGNQNPSVGTKYVGEIVRTLQDGISQGRKPVGIVIDYAGIMVERYMSAKNEKVENEFHYLNRFVNHIRTQVAGRFNCIAWVLHQLHGEAAAASPTTKQHHSKARGSRNFADNANFAFNIGTKDPQTNCCIVTCTKARRAEMVKNPPIVYIDGPFGRMEAQDQKYQLDQNTKKIVDRQLANMYQDNVKEINQMIGRKPKNTNPGSVSDI